MDEKSLSRALFRYVNELIVVPAFQMGLGGLISNPITGRVMVIATKGRKTEKIRYTPVNYAVIGKKIYCYQGKRLKGQWLLNILSDSHVEVLLPDRRISGIAQEVTDAGEKVDALRHILKGGGIAGFVYGFDPRTAPDRLIMEKAGDVHVVRITPVNLIKNL